MFVYQRGASSFSLHCALDLLLCIPLFSSLCFAVSDTYNAKCEGETPYDPDHPELGLNIAWLQDQYPSLQTLCDFYGSCRCKQTLNNPIVQVECEQRTMVSPGRNGRPPVETALRSEAYLAYCEERCTCENRLGKVAVKKVKEVSSRLSSVFESLRNSRPRLPAGRQCRSSCRSSNDCDVEMTTRRDCPNEDYLCRASDRTTSGKWAGAACVSSLDFGFASWSPGGKRDISEAKELAGIKQGLACPCNETYVSRSCCWAKDGIVYEDLLLKLGRLDDSL